MVEFPTVVLAGGEGRRMGGGKPLRLLNGRSLIERALAMARTWSVEVAVAVRDSRQVEGVGAPLIHDWEDIPGPLGGLAATLAWAADQGHDRVLTIPCDTPDLPFDLAQRLGAALGPGIGAIMAESGGQLHPTCSLWRTDGLQHVLAANSEGQYSLFAFAKRTGFLTVGWPDASGFFNINTLADLARASSQRRS